MERSNRAEMDALRALDLACYENAEAGGEGWALIDEVAALLDVSYVWACQLLRTCLLRGWVEKRWVRVGGYRKGYVVYGVSALGGELLLEFLEEIGADA